MIADVEEEKIWSAEKMGVRKKMGKKGKVFKSHNDRIFRGG